MQDWDDLRHVLAVQRTGSLAGAATSLRVDATTVGRRIDHLEERLGTPLFVRQRGAWRPTPAGERVVAAAERAEAAVAEAERAARELESTPTGRVHLTTVEAVATHLVAPLLPALVSSLPGVELLVSTTHVVLDLAKGEADLAIRVGTPSEPELVARRLGSFAEAPFAARAWLEARGLEADTLTNLDGAPLVVMPATGHRGELVRVGGGRVALRTGSTGTMLEAVASGVGVGLLPARVAERDPRLVPLEGLGIRRERDLWLLFREEVGRTPAVRAVVDLLVRGLARA